MEQRKILITSDSSMDLSPEIVRERGITVFPLHVILGAEDYDDGVNITPQMIFDYVAETKVLPKTSAGSVEEYAEFFRKHLEEYETVVHFNISSECSVTNRNAKEASNAFGGRVLVVDSRHLSTGQGLLVMKACDLRDEGKSAKEIVEEIDRLKEKTQTSFVVDTMEYLKKGGRCSSAAAFVATALKIHPSIRMIDGKLIAKKKYMGSLKRCISSYVDDLAAEFTDYDETRVFVTHSCCAEEIVELVKGKVAEKFSFKEMIETKAGAVVTSHCGQGTLGVLFICK